jgi:hypothetical protein
VAHMERGCQLIEAHNRRIAPTLLKAAYVLLAEPGKLRELLLGQAFLLPDPLDVSSDTSLRMSMRRRSADNEPLIYQL